MTSAYSKLNALCRGCFTNPKRVTMGATPRQHQYCNSCHAKRMRYLRSKTQAQARAWTETEEKVNRK